MNHTVPHEGQRTSLEGQRTSLPGQQTSIEGQPTFLERQPSSLEGQPTPNSNATNTNGNEVIHRKRRFICNLCNKVIISHLELPDHQALHSIHTTFTVEYENDQKDCNCYECGKVFVKSADLRRHIRDFHDRFAFGNNLVIKKPKEYQCKQCRSAFSEERLLRIHVAEIHEGRVCTCGGCGVQVKFLLMMWDHKRRVCGREFNVSYIPPKIQQCNDAIDKETPASDQGHATREDTPKNGLSGIATEVRLPTKSTSFPSSSVSVSYRREDNNNTNMALQFQMETSQKRALTPEVKKTLEPLSKKVFALNENRSRYLYTTLQAPASFIADVPVENVISTDTFTKPPAPYIISPVASGSKLLLPAVVSPNQNGAKPPMPAILPTKDNSVKHPVPAVSPPVDSSTKHPKPTMSPSLDNGTKLPVPTISPMDDVTKLLVPAISSQMNNGPKLFTPPKEDDETTPTQQLPGPTICPRPADTSAHSKSSTGHSNKSSIESVEVKGRKLSSRPRHQ